MATVAQPPMSPRPARREHPSELRVSMYDQVSGILVAALILFGFIVGMMMLIWMSGIKWKFTPAIPVNMVNEDVGGGGKGSGTGDHYVEEEFEEPSPDEIPPTTEVTKVEETLDAISLAVAAPEVVAELTLGEASSSWGNGKGKGMGDGEGDGFGPGTKAGIPAWERWEVRLNASTPAEYAKQLDFFKIELAIAGGGSPVVTYLTNVGAATATKRTGNPKEEKRLRFMHRSGALREADKKIFSKNGVDTSTKVMFQFYPKETYDKLLTLENIAMRPRSISEVRRTIFGVKEVGGGYEFFVISQEYR